MSKRVVWLMVSVAVASGLVVTVGLYRYLSSTPLVAAEGAANEVQVVVARKTLPRGTMLTAEHLQTVSRSADQLPGGVFIRADSLVGRVVAIQIPTGGPVTESQLVARHAPASAGSPTGLTLGYRAVGVFVDTRGGVLQFLQAGDHVDVVVTMEEIRVSFARKEPGPTRKRTVSKVLLQNVEVLEIPEHGQTALDRTRGTRDGTSFRWDPNKKQMPVILTLTPSDAEKLSLAMEIGTIHLIKRDAADDRMTQTSGVTQETLFATNAAQILIEVRFAEVVRTRSKKLGFDYIFQDKDVTQSKFLSGALSPQVPSTSNFTRVGSTVNDVSLSSAVTQLFEWRKGPDVTLALDSLVQQGLARILAEPNLLAVSGEEASFLAGGEFPIPIVQATTGSATSSSVTVEFKEFGVRLNFRPQVINREEIRLFVEPEVSVLNTGVGSVQIGGFVIPGLVTRRASTTVQMRSGESLVIGGLLSQVDSRTDKEMPYLSSIPILGSLFSSEEFKREETELIVLVTPRIVRPQAAHAPARFPDPKAVHDAIDAQLLPPPYPDPQAEALRRSILGGMEHHRPTGGESGAGHPVKP